MKFTYFCSFSFLLFPLFCNYSTFLVLFWMFWCVRVFVVWLAFSLNPAVKTTWLGEGKGTMMDEVVVMEDG